MIWEQLLENLKDYDKYFFQHIPELCDCPAGAFVFIIKKIKIKNRTHWGTWQHQWFLAVPSPLFYSGSHFIQIHWNTYFRFQGLVDGKLEKIICKLHSVLKYNCFEQRKVFNFHITEWKTERWDSAPKTKGGREPFGDS